MKKLLTLTLSLLMAFSLCLTISAEEGKGATGEIIASANGAPYGTLQEAVNAITNGEIYLYKNVKENITVDSGKEITLVINKDVTLTNNDKHTIVNNGILTITGEGTIDNVTHATGDIVNNYGATVTLQGGVKYTRSAEAGTSEGSGQNSWYNIQNYGTMTIREGTTVISSGSYSSLIRNGDGNTNEYATLTIESGNFSGGKNTVKNGSFGELYIKGGSFSNTTQATLLNWGKAEISGGEFSPTSSATNAVISSVWIEEDYETQGSTTITGGTFNGNLGFYSNETCKDSYKDGTYSISGGTFSSDVSNYLASDVNIAKVDNVYKVTKNGSILPVEKNTAAVEETVYETLNDKSVTVKDGASVTIDSSTEIILNSADIADEEKKEEAITKAKAAVSTTTETNYLPLNITLIAKKTGEQEKEITDLGEGNDITVTIYLNNETLKLLKDKDIKVVRIHTENGEEKIDTLNANLSANALTFKTNKFSTYVIAYSTKASTTETKSYSAKDKNQDGVISCEEEKNSANWIWSTTKKACVYKVSNTSVR